MSEIEDEEIEEANQPADLKQFRAKVRKYITLPDQIKVAAEPVKELKAELKELEKDILAYMHTNNVSHLDVPESSGGGTIVIQQSVTKAPAKKEHWEKAVANFAKKRRVEISYEDLEAELSKAREMRTVSKLKRRKA